jgi:CHAT domain-containing protein
MRKEMRTIQWLRRPSVKSLSGKHVTQSAVIDGLRSHPFAHIAGSFKFEPGTGRPLDARLGLHAGERLTLLDVIARCAPGAPLPGAEFAFLSASHTAEVMPDNGMPDEALHLTAAMLHCGFRSVVGTMWGMADMDGKDVCKRFYKHIFARAAKGRGKGGRGKEDSLPPYHERAAEALRDAVQKLRKKKGVTVDRWVTYVHYGA